VDNPESRHYGPDLRPVESNSPVWATRPPPTSRLGTLCGQRLGVFRLAVAAAGTLKSQLGLCRHFAIWHYRPSAIAPSASVALRSRGDVAARVGMKILMICSSKGGAGKTTVAQCLAVEALRQGLAAAIIDTDPQKSAAEWGEQRVAADLDAPTVIALGSNRLTDMVDDLRKRGAGLVVIDTPPHSAPAINVALDVSTASVMVTRPNPMDVRALEATWGIVSRMKKPAATIFTQTPPGNRARALRLAQGRLEELKIPFCPTPMSYTLSFPYAQAEALAVQEREPTGKSRAEIAEIWGWLKRMAIL
jgi:chromosome partitioning protein